MATKTRVRHFVGGASKDGFRLDHAIFARPYGMGLGDSHRTLCGLNARLYLDDFEAAPNQCPRCAEKAAVPSERSSDCV